MSTPRKWFVLWAAGLIVMGVLTGKSNAEERMQDHGGESHLWESLDAETLKANGVERIVQQKVSKIVEAAMISERDYRVAVNVTVKKKIGSAEDSADTDSSNDGVSDQNSDKSPNGESLLSVDDLIRHAEKERTRVEGSANPTRASLRGLEVDTVQVQVSFSERVNQESKTAVEASLKSQLGQTYGDKFKLETKTLPAPEDEAKKAPPVGAVDNLAKIQFLVVAIVMGLALLGGLLMFKLIPGKQGQFPFRIQLSSDGVTPVPGLSGGTQVPQGNQWAQPELAAPSPIQNADQATLVLGQIQSLEEKIAQFGKKNAKLAEKILEQWAGEEAFSKITLFLEAMAKSGIELHPVSFRTDIANAIRESRRQTSQLSLPQKLATLEEAYWGLVSDVFLGADELNAHFSFLEEMDDESLVSLIEGEGGDAQVAILLNLSEKRSARILSQLDSELRQVLVQGLFKTERLEKGALGQIAMRLREQAKRIVSSRPKTVQMSQGVASLIPMLESMSFENQFETSNSLLALPEELKKDLEQNYFNVAFLQDAKDEFLDSVFRDRASDWSHSVLAILGQDLYERVLKILPPLQSRMIRDQQNSPVSPSFAWSVLRELNEDILSQLNRGDLTPGQIYAEELIQMAGTSEEGAPDLGVGPQGFNEDPTLTLGESTLGDGEGLNEGESGSDAA